LIYIGEREGSAGHALRPEEEKKNSEKNRYYKYQVRISRKVRRTWEGGPFGGDFIG